MINALKALNVMNLMFLINVIAIPRALTFLGIMEVLFSICNVTFSI